MGGGGLFESGVSGIKKKRKRGGGGGGTKVSALKISSAMLTNSIVRVSNLRIEKWTIH
jgi:hypothetical protein